MKLRLLLLLFICTVTLLAAPAPQLKSVSSTPITASSADQSFVGTGARLNSPLRVFLREASVSAWTEIPQATSVNMPAGRFTWHWTFEDSGDYYMKLRNPDGKDSSQLKFTVQGTQPSLSIYCPANQTVTSPDGQPFAVTFPSPTTTGGVAPITVTTAPVNGSLFPVGTTTVTGTADDATSQTPPTCTFTVTVVVAPPPPTANCDVGVNLNANILLDGADVLEWVGTPSSPCIVNGNGFRIMVDGGGSWTGRFKCSNAVITGLGNATLHAIGDNGGMRYAYLNGSQIDIQNCEFHQGGNFEFFSANGATQLWRNNTYAADNLVPAGHDAAENIPWFTDTGSSTAPKVFQGNKIYRAYANFNSPNWTIGAPKGVPCTDPTVTNLFIGPRVGFQLMNPSSYASCNYVHVNLDVTPQKDYWSQVLAMGWCGAGSELGPNIFRTGHWVLRGVDCIANDVIVVEGSGHAHISLGNGGTINRPLVFGMYAGCARYSACQYGLPASIETQQDSNVLTVNNAIMDLRGPDGAITPFVQGAGTLTHSGETVIRLSSTAGVRGPLTWATSQAGIAGAENAGFPFNDEDLLNGTSTLQDWISYLRWIYAPAGSGGTAPRLAQTNQRPSVNIGAPILDLPVGTTEAQLSGYAADDRGPLSVRWTLLSGPNTPMFSDPTLSTGKVTNLVPGTYKLRFTASDGTLNTAKDLTINVAGSTPPPQPGGTNTIWLDPTTLARLKSKAAANDPDWLTVKAQADKYTTWAVAPYAQSGCVANTICYDWQGGGWYDAALQLGLAYQVTGDDKYAAKVRELMTAMALPAKSGNLQPITTDAGYPSRTIGSAVAWGYAWTGNTWSAQLKTDVFDSLNKWHDWTKANAQSNTGPCCTVGSVAVSNYFGGHIMGFGMAGLATRGANPRGQEIADHWRNAFNLVEQEFTSGVYQGGYPIEGYNYGINHFFRLILYAHALKTSTGEDLMFKYAPIIIKNLFYNLKPNRFQWTDESNYSGDTTGLIDRTLLNMFETIAPPPWNAYVKYLRTNMAPVPGQYGEVQPIYRFIFGDNSVTTTDYKPASSLVYNSPGDGHVYVRTDWTDNAVWSSFNACSCHLGGHAMRGAGHVAIQRGTDYLLVNSGQWKGQDGIAGDPYAFDLRSWRMNTLWYNNPWDANYDGGQGWWGSQQGFTLDYQETPTYVYKRAEEMSAYTYIPTGLVSFKRSWVNLRDGQIVVFDSVKAGDPTHLKKIVWHVPPTGPRTISGNRFSSIQGGSKLTIQTLLPANAPLSVQGDPEFDGSNRMVTYRLEVSGANNSVDWTVVTVLQATAASMTPPTATVTSGAQVVVSGIGKTVTFNPDGSLVSVQ